MDFIHSLNIVELAGGLFAAIVALVLALQTVSKNWLTTNTENTLLETMQKELTRMGNQNTALSGEIGRLQTELIKLSNQLSLLSAENAKLQKEIQSLNVEISRLNILTIKM